MKILPQILIVLCMIITPIITSAESNSIVHLDTLLPPALELEGPIQIMDGTHQDGYILISDSLGRTCWIHPDSLSSTVWTRMNNVVSNGGGNYSSDDLLFGAPTLDFDGQSIHRNKMFFDKSKAAFRAGYVDADWWNADSTGNYSFGAGVNVLAKGSYSMATGYGSKASRISSTAMGHLSRSEGDVAVALGLRSIASGNYSTALGVDCVASGFLSTAFGDHSKAIGNYSFAMGNYNTSNGVRSTSLGYRTIANGYSGLVIGTFNDTTVSPQTAITNTTPLFVIGNGSSLSNRSNAMLVRKDGRVGIATNAPDATLHVNGSHHISSTGGIGLARIESSSTVGTWLCLGNTSAGGKWYNIISTGSANGEGSGKLLFQPSHAYNIGAAPTLALDPTRKVGIGVHSPIAQLALGNWNSGGSGDSIQLQLSGVHNVGTNAGSVNGTHKLLIDGYNNDGPIVYPIYVEDENKYVDFYLKNRPSAAGKPSMYFAGNFGVGTTTPDATMHVVGSSHLSGGSVGIGLSRIESGSTVGSWFSLGNTSAGGKWFNILSTGSANGEGSGKFLIIPSNQYNLGGASALAIDSQGQVGIGMHSPTAKLEVNAEIVKKVNGGSWTASSDRRLKKEIKPYTAGLDDILSINAVKFKYNELSGYDSSVEHIGVIAQELEQIAPYMVSTFKQKGAEYLQVDNSAMTYMLINAIKELKAENESLKSGKRQMETAQLEIRSELHELKSLLKEQGLVSTATSN